MDGYFYMAHTTNTSYRMKGANQMDPEKLLQGQHLQQQLRQLEMQLQLYQQQLGEPWQSELQPQKMEQQTQSGPQQQEPKRTEPQQQKPQEQQKQLPTYFTAPEMISTLDIGNLRDMLSANLLAVKQYQQASKDCQLADLKLQFKEASQMHLQHYNKLLSFLSETGAAVK